jgi:putative membrane protein
MRNWPAILLAPSLAFANGAVTYALVLPSCSRQARVRAARGRRAEPAGRACLHLAVVAQLARAARRGAGRRRRRRAPLPGQVGTMVGLLSALVVLAEWLPQWIVRHVPSDLPALALLPLPAYAHDVAAAPGAPAWTFEPWVLLCLLLSALNVRLPGWLRLRRRSPAGRRRAAAGRPAFFGGWLALAAALVSPLDALGASLFSAHMLQHEADDDRRRAAAGAGAAVRLLDVGAAGAVAAGVGAGARHPFVAGTWLLLTWPLFAWLLHAAVLWLWHAPPLFEAALHSRGMHTLQHASFPALGAAVLVGGARRRQLRAAAARRGDAVHLHDHGAHRRARRAADLVGDGLVSLVSAHDAGIRLHALEDQQLGGLIMWVPGGLAYLFAGLALAARWLARPPGPVRMPVAHDGQ